MLTVVDTSSDAAHRDALLSAICSVEIRITNREIPTEATTWGEIGVWAVCHVMHLYNSAKELGVPVVSSTRGPIKVQETHGSLVVHCSWLLGSAMGHFRPQECNPESLDLVDDQVGYVEKAYLVLDTRLVMAGKSMIHELLNNLRRFVSMITCSNPST